METGLRARRRLTVAAGAIVAVLLIAGLSVPAVAQDAAEFCMLGRRITSGYPGIGETIIERDSDWQFGYADEDGDSQLDPSDPVYFDADVPNRISDRDVRWTPYDQIEAGTRPVQGDPDLGGTLTELFNAVLRYHDANGNDAVDPSERIYLDADGSQDVDAGEVILHPESDAGTQVGFGQTPVDDALDNLLGDIRFWDKNNDTRFDADETLFFDLNDSGTLTAGDVCLSNEEEPEPEPEPTVDPTPTDDPTPTTDPTQGTDPTDETDDETTPPGDRSIPALPGLVGVAAALAGLLLVRRQGA